MSQKCRQNVEHVNKSKTCLNCSTGKLTERMLYCIASTSTAARLVYNGLTELITYRQPTARAVVIKRSESTIIRALK
jgi:hypothetical protein